MLPTVESTLLAIAREFRKEGLASSRVQVAGSVPTILVQEIVTCPLEVAPLRASRVKAEAKETKRARTAALENIFG